MQASKKSEDPSPKIQKEEEEDNNNKEEKTEEVEAPELPSNESPTDNVKEEEIEKDIVKEDKEEQQTNENADDKTAEDNDKQAENQENDQDAKDDVAADDASKNEENDSESELDDSLGSDDDYDKNEQDVAKNNDDKDVKDDQDKQPSDDNKVDEPKDDIVSEQKTEEVATTDKVDEEAQQDASPEIVNNKSDISAYSQSAQVNEASTDEHSHWLKGEKYILIDAGGGTCDVACHEIMGDFAVQEIVHPTGGPWGSTYIDDHFVSLLKKIFNEEWIANFKKEDPSAYTELIDNFRFAKQEFWKAEKGHADNDDDSNANNNNNDDDNNKQQVLSEEMSNDEKIKLYAEKWHNVELPFDFSSFLEERVDDMKSEQEGCDLETMVETTEIMGQTKLCFIEDEYLRLNYLVWTTQLFDKVLDPILNHVTHLLTETIMKDNTAYICLVGGLGSSKYLQYRLTSAFGPSSKYGLNIIIPSRPILSVVDGAARFGLRPDYIQARTLAKTYGNAIDPKLDVIDVDALPPGYLEKNQYRCDHTNMLRVRNIFSVYARKNDTINVHDKPIIRKYKRFNIKQKKVRISVYSSDEEDPKVVKDKPCAKTTVVFPPNSTELSIIVELYFSDTKIRVFAYPEDDPKNKKEMELEYSWKE